MAAASTSGNPSWSSTPSSAPISLHYPPQRFAATIPPTPPAAHALIPPARSLHPLLHPHHHLLLAPLIRLTPTTDVDRGYTSHLPPSPKTQSFKAVSVRRGACSAKLVQKAKRREQNRNAQRRLRDRKEEHIFKLEGKWQS